MFGKLNSKEWHIFSQSIETRKRHKNCILSPINNSDFLSSLEGSDGLITSAGFESCAEAMYLNKKLLTIPILYQYEQYCNAAALKEMGITVIPQISETLIEKIALWMDEDERIVLKKFSTGTDVITKLKQLYHS